MRRHAARSWYALLPSLRAAYWQSASRALAGQVPPHAVPPLEPFEEDGRRIIHVGIHHRSVKRRRFSNMVYHSLLDAVRARHAAYERALVRGGGSGGSGGGGGGGGGDGARRAGHEIMSLRIHVHSDHTFDPDPTTAEEREQRRTKPGLLLTLACADSGDPQAVLTMHCKRRAGLTVYTPDEVSDPLASMHHLAQMDVLILSESSFSAVPALLGNMTVLLPMCHGPQIFTSRSPLPHWLSVPCTGNTSEIESIVGRMPWPPPQNRWP